MSHKYIKTAAAAGATALLLGAAPMMADDTRRSWDTITWDDLFQEDRVHTNFNSVAELKEAVALQRAHLSALLPQLDEDFTQNIPHSPGHGIPPGYEGETCHSITFANLIVSDIAYDNYNGDHSLELMSIPFFTVVETPAVRDNGVLVPDNALRQNPVNDPYEADIALAADQAAKTIGDANGPRIPVIGTDYIGCESSVSGLFAIATDLNRASVEMHMDRLDAFVDAYERHNPAP